MSSAREMEARIAAARCHFTKRIDAMNEGIVAMQQRIQRDFNTEALRGVFNANGKVEQYKWTYEYSFQLGRRCFASNKLLLPSTRAYKGTFAVGREIFSNSLPPTTVYPEEIWITKEEFTMRRLKGLL